MMQLTKYILALVVALLSVAAMGYGYTGQPGMGGMYVSTVGEMEIVVGDGAAAPFGDEMTVAEGAAAPVGDWMVQMGGAAAPVGDWMVQMGGAAAPAVVAPVVVEHVDTAELTLWFRVNKTTIDPSYRDNAVRLAEFRSRMSAIVARGIKKLEVVLVVGTASPEGSYYHNIWLGQQRGAAIRDFIAKEYGFDIKKFAIHSEGENWDELRTMVEAGDYKYKNDVLKILSGNLRMVTLKRSNELKRRLKALQKGRVWQYLLRNYYPALRLSRNTIVLTWDEEVDDVVDTVVDRTMDGTMGDSIQIVSADTLQASDKDDTLQASDRDDTLQASELDSVQSGRYDIEDMTGHVARWTDTLRTDTLPTVDTEVLQPTKVWRREMLSVKTNLLFDFAWVPGYDRFCPIPNVAVEFYPLHGHFTVGASFDGPWWQHYDEQKYFQVRNYQVHGRYYFRSGDVRLRQPGKGAAFKGFYLSAYAHTGLYSICFDANHGWEGEYWGAGLGAGYVVGLGRKEHWRLEFGIQGGYIQTRYDPYQWLCPIDPTDDEKVYYYKWYGKASEFKRRQHIAKWLGPTRVEVTLSWDLLYRKKFKN